MKRILVFALLLTAISPIATPVAHAADHQICLAYDTGGPGDRSFNDAAAAGVKQAQKTLSFTLATTVTSGDAKDRLNRMRALIAKQCAIVIAVGSGYAATIKELSTEFADQQFAILNDVSIDALNVTAITFADIQGAYLAGFAAALSSKSGKIAMIGYSSQSSIYTNGFLAGARSAKKNINAQVRYISGSASAEAATLLRSGVDVVYLATTGSADDVFGVIVQANKTRSAQRPAALINVEPDQFFTVDAANKKFVIATIVKRVDLALLDLIKTTIAGSTLYDEIDPDLGVFGRSYGISQKAVEITVRSPALLAAAKRINLAGKIAADLEAK